jgi:hypothetical protein
MLSLGCHFCHYSIAEGHGHTTLRRLPLQHWGGAGAYYSKAFVVAVLEVVRFSFSAFCYTSKVEA